MPEYKKGRMDAKRAAQSEAAQIAVTVVRRLGFAASKAHQALMSSLLRNDPEAAEAFNNAFKPLVDLMVHFELPVQQELFDDGEV